MGRKFIKQIINQDFVYPNADVSEYDVEIVHDLNNNSVSGTVTNFTATTFNATGVTFSFSYSWSLNGAEPFVNDFNNLNIFSVHCMGPTQQYYKPWRVVDGPPLINYTGQTSVSGTQTLSVTPSELGVSSLTNGTYYFEIRMIGHRAIYPICVEFTVAAIPTPTPTPATPTPTPTPTLTPTATPGASIYTSGATLNVTDTGYIKYTNNSGSTTYFNCTTLGTQVLTDCLVCNSITYGYPFANLAEFSITNCGNSCGGVSPTPTPTPTPGTSYYYYTVDVYDCFPCSYIAPAIARSSTPLNLTFFYNIGDGNVYQVTGSATGPAYDVNLDGYASNPDCNNACSI